MNDKELVVERLLGKELIKCYNCEEHITFTKMIHPYISRCDKCGIHRIGEIE